MQRQHKRTIEIPNKIVIVLIFIFRWIEYQILIFFAQNRSNNSIAIYIFEQLWPEIRQACLIKAFIIISVPPPDSIRAPSGSETTNNLQFSNDSWLLHRRCLRLLAYRWDDALIWRSEEWAWSLWEHTTTHPQRQTASRQLRKWRNNKVPYLPMIALLNYALLGLLAKIKCSICSYQCNNW
jgi:hypothetical protein